MKSINDQLYGFSYELNHTTEEDLTTCFAIDTGTVFVAYGGVWYEQPTRWAEQSGSGGGGGTGGGVLVVNVTIIDGVRTCDKTAGEIWAAFQTGLVYFAESENGDIVYMSMCSAADHKDGYSFYTVGGSYIASESTDYPTWQQGGD